MAPDLQSMLQPLLLNLVGWLRFWFLPRFLSAAVIIFIANLLSRWFDGMWRKWLALSSFLPATGAQASLLGVKFASFRFPEL
jgi:hypothetical protein